MDAACKLFEIGRNNDDFWVVGRVGGGGGTADWLWASRLSYTAFTHPTHPPGVNGLEAAAVTPPPGLFTRGAFGNPNNPFTPFLSQLPGRSGISTIFFLSHFNF